MEQSTSSWPNGFGFTPSGNMVMDQHMTVNPADLTKDFSHIDDTLCNVHHGLRYLPIHGLQRDFSSTTLPDIDLDQGLDTDMLNVPAFPPYQQIDTSQYYPDYEDNTTPQMTTLQSSWESNTATSFMPVASQIPPDAPIQGLERYSQSTEREGQDTSTPKPIATKAVKSSKPRRKDKVIYRRAKSRNTISPPSLLTSSTSDMSQHTSISSEADNASSHQVDVRLDFETFNPTSTLAQRKKAYLVKQMKALADQQADLERQMPELMVDDQMFGGHSDEEGTDHLAGPSTATSSTLSTTNFDIDSDDTADHTSISSAPRQPVTVTVAAEATQRKHDKCIDCGVKTLYYCTYKGCGHATHSFADYKRHEAGVEHWPQNRFMCLKCIPRVTNECGNIICGFCNMQLDQALSALEEHSLVCNLARRNATTFSRSDHLVEHMRKYHPIQGISKTEQKQINKDATTWQYPIDSNWPRQCGFCGDRFQTWTERMQHLAEHFHAGFSIKDWKLPFLPPKDFTPGPSFASRKRDDDEDDNHDKPSGGQGGSRNNASSHQNGASNITSRPKNSQSGYPSCRQGQRSRGGKNRQQNSNSKDGSTHSSYTGAASKEAGIMGIDDAEIGEFAYDYIELTRGVFNAAPDGDSKFERPGGLSHRSQDDEVLFRFTSIHATKRRTPTQPLALQRYLEDPYEPTLARLNLGSEPGSCCTSQRDAIHASINERGRYRDVSEDPTLQTCTTTSSSLSFLHHDQQAYRAKRASRLRDTYDGKLCFDAAESLLRVCLGLYYKDMITSTDRLFCALETCKKDFQSTNLIGWFTHCLSHPMVQSAFFALLRGDKTSQANPQSTRKMGANSDSKSGLIRLATYFDNAATRPVWLYTSPVPMPPNSQHHTFSFKLNSRKRLPVKPNKLLCKPTRILLTEKSSEALELPWVTQDKPCKFCGKHFPTWKKLTVHLAKHMEYKGAVEFKSDQRSTGSASGPKRVASIQAVPLLLDQHQKTDISSGLLHEFRKVAEGLDFLHRNLQTRHDPSVALHFDLKPRNICMNLVVGIDFGTTFTRVAWAFAPLDVSITSEHDAYFSKPFGFHDSSLYLDVEAELEAMIRALFDLESTLKLLIQSSPSVGKTQIARECVYSPENIELSYLRVEASEYAKNEIHSSLSAPSSPYGGSKKRMFCMQCNGSQQGFHGEYELRRHQSREHRWVLKKRKWIDTNHPKSAMRYKVCRQRKKTRAYYNAAAHLRRSHFMPNAIWRTKKIKGHGTEERRRNWRWRYSHTAVDLIEKFLGDPIGSTLTSEPLPSDQFLTYPFCLNQVSPVDLASSAYDQRCDKFGRAISASSSSYGKASQASPQHYIRPGAGETEQCDSSYREGNAEWKKFFECSRIFKILWADPAGPSDQSKETQSQVAQAQYVHSKIRRFVVVSQNHRSVQCLPITTYDSKGYQKRGIKLEEHGLIYTGAKSHELDRPENTKKCPISTCEYHIKGFARKYDRNRHTLSHYKGTMVCGFCSGSGSAAEKSFNRSDVFKRHLTLVHGVQQTPSKSRNRGVCLNSTGSFGTGIQTIGLGIQSGRCSTCPAVFADAQKFHDHLDECILRVVEHDTASHNQLARDDTDQQDKGSGREEERKDLYEMKSQSSSANGCQPNLGVETTSLPSNPTIFRALGIVFANMQLKGNIPLRPRLGKEEVDILETAFKINPKPTTQMKRQFAESFGVDLARINNWFQNRRAKRRQESKQAKYEAEASGHFDEHEAPSATIESHITVFDGTDPRNLSPTTLLLNCLRLGNLEFTGNARSVTHLPAMFREGRDQSSLTIISPRIPPLSYNPHSQSLQLERQTALALALDI